MKGAKSIQNVINYGHLFSFDDMACCSSFGQHHRPIWNKVTVGTLISASASFTQIIYSVHDWMLKKAILLQQWIRLTHIQCNSCNNPPRGFKSLQMLCGTCTNYGHGGKRDLWVQGGLVFHISLLDMLIGCASYRVESWEEKDNFVASYTLWWRIKNNLIFRMELLNHQNIYIKNTCITFTQISQAKVW